MAEEPEHEGSAPTPTHKGKWDTKTVLMVGGTVAAAIAAWLLYKHSSSSPAPTAVVTGGGIAGTGAASPSSGAPQTVSISTTSPTGGSFHYTGPPTSAPPPSAYPSPPSTSTGSGSASSSQTSTTTQPNPSVAAATVNYSTLMPMGSGYSVSHTGHLASGVVQGATGAYYSTEATYTSTLAAIAAGKTVAYQSAPGVFTKITSVTQFKKIEPAGPSGGPTDTTTYVKT